MPNSGDDIPLAVSRSHQVRVVKRRDKQVSADSLNWCQAVKRPSNLVGQTLRGRKNLQHPYRARWSRLRESFDPLQLSRHLAPVLSTRLTIRRAFAQSIAYGSKRRHARFELPKDR